MNNEQLKTFITVVKTQSFSKAADQSYITKQSMLKQINSLEEEVGCRLLERSRTGTRLTEAGEIFFHGAKNILRDWDELVTECRRTSATEFIRIGSVEHQVLLNPVNEAFAKKYPEVEIRRIVHPNHSGEYRVAHGIMDVGETFRNDTDVFRDVFEFTPLLKMHYLAAMRNGHPLSSSDSLSLSEMKNYPVLVFPMMLPEEYLHELQSVFQDHPDHLIMRDDVDNQVGAAFECSHSDHIMITANPFIYSVSDLMKIPLRTEWTREYGLISMPDCPPVVRRYIETAREVYRNRVFG